MLDRVNQQVLKFKKSGIRKFAEAAAKIDGVVSLTIGEPEFNTDDLIKNSAKLALDHNVTHYPLDKVYQNLERPFLSLNQRIM